MAKSGSLKPSGDDTNNSTTKKKPPEKQPVVSPQFNKKEDTLCVANTPVKITTPVSILIESLVKNLCMAYEKDHKKATVVYNLICDKLFQMKLIDESYTMEEFEGMRSQYQKAFYQVFSAAMGSDSAVPLGPLRPTCEIISSHYHDEFDELEYIAGGGFGQVSKRFTALIFISANNVGKNLDGMLIFVCPILSNFDCCSTNLRPFFIQVAQQLQIAL